MDPEPPPPRLASLLDLRQPLGSGSTGSVYAATLTRPYADLPEGATVAAKFLRQDLMGDPEAQSRLHAEGRLGQTIRSPYVARIHGVETVEVLGLEVTYLVMELLEGETVRSFLASGRMAVEDFTRRVGRDVARGLTALHGVGVVHRDLKPENLHVTTQGTIKVVDLGLARRTGKKGAAGSGGLAGTVLYAAPEVLRGRAATAAADIYALGVVLFELATGRHPFAEHTDVDAVIHAHIDSPPPRPSHLRPRTSAFLEEVILSLLDKNPRRRPNAEDVANLLDEGEASAWWRKHMADAPVLAARSRLRRARRTAVTPFFGRRLEQDLLSVLRIRLRNGRGAALCVHGPRGIGRRRLLDECVEAWLAESDAPGLLLGAADRRPERGRGQPFPELVLDGLLGRRDEGPNLDERLAHRLTDLGLGSAAADRLAEVLSGQRAVDTDDAPLLARALLGLANERPFVLRIDHGEDLDPTACAALREIIEAEPPILVLLVTGPEGLPDGLPKIQGLEVSGLSAEDARRFAGELFERGHTPRDLDLVLAPFAGSPGNLIEALEHQVEVDALEGAPGSYRNLRAQLPLPPAPTHLDRVARRMEGLSPQQRHVLSAAAVLGQEADIGDLAAVVGRPKLHVLEDLSVFRGRVVRASGGSVSFRHRAFRDALLRWLPDGQRQRLHRLAAFALQEHGGSPLQVGLHLSRALEHEACLSPLLDALEDLVESGSRKTSRRVGARLEIHFRQLGEDTDAVRRGRERFALLESRRLRAEGDRKQATEHLRTAIGSASRAGHDLQHAQALVELADLARENGQFGAALGQIQQALEIRGVRDDAAMRHVASRAHELMGIVLGWTGGGEPALHHLRVAAELGADASRPVRARIQILRARLESLRFHLAAARKTFVRVGEWIDEDDPAGLRCNYAVYRGRLHGVLGEDPKPWFDDAEEIARHARLPEWEGRVAICRAEEQLWHGLDAADQLSVAEERAATAGDRITETMARIHHLGTVLGTAELGSTVEQLNAPELLGAWLVYETRRHRAEGRTEMAVVCIDEALDLARQADLPLRWHVTILRESGRGERARALLHDLAQRFRGADRRRFLRAFE